MRDSITSTSIITTQYTTSPPQDHTTQRKHFAALYREKRLLNEQLSQERHNSRQIRNILRQKLQKTASKSSHLESLLDLERQNQAIAKENITKRRRHLEEHHSQECDTISQQIQETKRKVEEAAKTLQKQKMQQDRVQRLENDLAKLVVTTQKRRDRYDKLQQDALLALKATSRRRPLSAKEEDQVENYDEETLIKMTKLAQDVTEQYRVLEKRRGERKLNNDVEKGVKKGVQRREKRRDKLLIERLQKELHKLHLRSDGECTQEVVEEREGERRNPKIAEDEFLWKLRDKMTEAEEFFLNTLSSVYHDIYMEKYTAALLSAILYDMEKNQNVGALSVSVGDIPKETNRATHKDGKLFPVLLPAEEGGISIFTQSRLWSLLHVLLGEIHSHWRDLERE
mmetsp:Transcript_63006/g.74533  ORF Transcript_63006/g.74533 Transcript_63006/m.74533 type:complete len:398 (-) Transcript_63006:123-1316(-)|eukprot:CAMPEP_0172517884 /NCGR_PEP_ID=MMETSP1066-20121228/288673_1 /TAXON_ID=671091 /ORGANISM="Coscinodiscus wailesii, Strain CCMP2513" /LENGTH=397 /DNA_ID=CAMNT_0013300089 /DNA_START=146 /DNA_END=1339 /DNA_ORIENTATION=+